ncbi:MAG: MarR family transcriptional regulator [Rubrivivax sp.]|nr:MarR family transcriptional regulator [Rubrivivax sp.]
MGTTAGTTADGHNALAMMAETLTRPPAPPPAPQRAAAGDWQGEGPTARLMRHLSMHGRATARELAQVAGVGSAVVGALLKNHLKKGLVTCDRTFWPVVYVLREEAHRQKRAAEPGAARAELLEWHDATLRKPDSDLTVLCWGSEGFFCGWWDDGMGCWIGCESGGTVLGVTHWAEPEGPPGFERGEQPQHTGGDD